MKNNKVFMFIAFVLGFGSLLLSRVIWPDPPDFHLPGPDLMPFFVLYAIFESAAFGFGVAYLITFWNRFRGMRAIHLSLVWVLASWYPHDNLHRVINEENFLELLRIEYMFHFTIIVAGIVLVRYVLSVLDGKNVVKNEVSMK